MDYCGIASQALDIVAPAGHDVQGLHTLPPDACQACSVLHMGVLCPGHRTLPPGTPRVAGYMDSSLWLLHLCHLEGFHPQRLSFQVNVCLQKTGRPTVSRVVCSPKAYRRAEGGAQCGAVSGLRLAIRVLRAVSLAVPRCPTFFLPASSVLAQSGPYPRITSFSMPGTHVSE